MSGREGFKYKQEAFDKGVGCCQQSLIDKNKNKNKHSVVAVVQIFLLTEVGLNLGDDVVEQVVVVDLRVQAARRVAALGGSDQAHAFCVVVAASLGGLKVCWLQWWVVAM